MKKSFGVLLLIAGASTNLQADCDCKVSSHTFFSVRPLYQSASPERVSLFHDPMVREEGRGGNFELTFLGGKSTRNKGLARFFTPFCKDSLLVLENPTAGTPDLIAQNFNIDTVNGTFQSNIQFKMHESVFAIGLTYRQSFGGRFSDEEGNRRLWVEISSPVTRVHNTVILEEQIVNNGGGAAVITGLPAGQVIVDSMTAAFNQSDWLYGKIDPTHKLTKWRLADIEAKIGYEWMSGEQCGVESYVGVLIPTGYRPKAEYIFEPIVGHNKHVGIMWGNSAYYKLCETNCWNIDIYADTCAKYLFRRNETRSFDLKNKPWSRYIELYANFAQAQQANALAVAGNIAAAATLSTPGINLLTQDLKVTPRFSYTVNCAVAAKSQRCDLELGWNFFAREAECVRLANAFTPAFAMKSPLGAGATMPVRTINNNFLAANQLAFSAANFSTSLIQESDLDLESAAHPAVLSNSIYGAAGYRWDDRCYPMFAGFGGNYEFGKDNSVLNRWTVWGKCGVSF